jgi:hypothetical protein
MRISSYVALIAILQSKQSYTISTEWIDRGGFVAFSVVDLKDFQQLSLPDRTIHLQYPLDEKYS